MSFFFLIVCLLNAWSLTASLRLISSKQLYKTSAKCFYQESKADFWANSGRRWRTWKPSVLQSLESQSRTQFSYQTTKNIWLAGSSTFLHFPFFPLICFWAIFLWQEVLMLLWLLIRGKPVKFLKFRIILTLIIYLH